MSFSSSETSASFYQNHSIKTHFGNVRSWMNITERTWLNLEVAGVFYHVARTEFVAPAISLASYSFADASNNLRNVNANVPGKLSILLKY